MFLAIYPYALNNNSYGGKMKKMEFPGGPMSKRELQIFFIADCSGSMNEDGKMQSLNNAIKCAIPAMQDEAKQNSNANVYVRAIEFSSGAQWLIPQKTNIQDFKWTDLTAEGDADIGEAFNLVSDMLDESNMPRRMYPPVLILVTDGHPTDDYESALAKLQSQPWGIKAARMGIAIGKDANIDVLEKFVDNPEIPVLNANNSEQLTVYLEWSGTLALIASSPPSKPSKAGSKEGKSNVYIPALPYARDLDAEDDWPGLEDDRFDVEDIW